MGAQIIGGQSNDVTLDVAAERVGDSLSIALSQDAASLASWRLDVDVQGSQGRFRLGSVVVPAPGGAQPASRIVAFAVCPGARAWWVSASSATIGEVADLVLESSKCCGAALGVLNNSFST